MRCPICNEEIEYGQKFCDHCGTRLTENLVKEPQKEQIKESQKDSPKSSKKGAKKKKSNNYLKILIPVCMAAVFILSFVGTVIFTKPQNVQTDSLEQKLDLGNKYLASAEYEKAEVAFSEALKIDKKSPDAAIGLAKIYNEKKEPEEALRMLEKASDNMQTLSKQSSNRQNSGYQKVYQQTSDLFRKKGDMEKAVQTEDLYEEVKIYVVITPEPEEILAAELDRTESEETEEIPILSEENPQPEEGMSGEDFSEEANQPSSEEQPDDNENSVPIGNITGTPEEEGNLEEDVEIPDNPEENMIEEGKEEQENTPIEEQPEETEEAVDAELELPDEPEQIVYTTDEIASESGEASDDFPELPDENSEEIYVEELPDEEMYMPENDYEAQDNMDETSDEITTEEEVPEDLLRRYTDEVILAQNPISDFNGCAVDVNNPSSLNGTLGIHMNDLNGDGASELLVISMTNGTLVFDLYCANNGEVIQIGDDVGLSNSFGTYTDGLSYGVTQECFVTNSGDIGIATHCYGKMAEDGNPCIETSAALYRFEEDKSISFLGSAAIVNGNTVYTNGDSSSASEGNADTFCSILNQYGLNGNWIYDSTNTLEQMGLSENPYQDMAGVPNPLSSGISSYEGGQDLIIASGDKSAEDTSMYISVQNYTTF